MKPQYAALVGRINQALVDIERVVNRAELLLNKARQNSDDGYLDGVALNLYSFYTGIEAIFEDIARNVEGTIPSGPSWHPELLLQMSAELGSLRPAVISNETRYCLGEYPAFGMLSAMSIHSICDLTACNNCPKKFMLLSVCQTRSNYLYSVFRTVGAVVIYIVGSNPT